MGCRTGVNPRIKNIDKLTSVSFNPCLVIPEMFKVCIHDEIGLMSIEFFENFKFPIFVAIGTKGICCLLKV